MLQISLIVDGLSKAVPGFSAYLRGPGTGRPHLIFWLALIAGPALAQAPPSAASIMRLQESATPQPRPQVAPLPAVQQERSPGAAATGGALVRVRSIRFVGGEGWADEAPLAALAQALVGQAVNSAQLLDLTEQISSQIKSQGWLLAQAYLPPQDVTEGDIEIRLLPGSLEGGLDGIVVKGTQRVSAERIRRSVAASMAASQGRLHADRLEAGLLRVGELAGVSATASLQRGDQPGTTRLTIEASETPLAGGGVTVDNFGGPYTGVNRVTGLLLLNSPFGLGDSWVFNGSGSTGIEMLTTQTDLPVGVSGWKVGASHTALRYRVGGDLTELGLKGQASMVGVNASYPLHLSPSQKLRLRLGADHKAFEDTASGERIGDKVAKVLSITVSGQYQDAILLGGTSDWSLGAHRGRMDLSRLADTFEQDQAGPRAHGGFHKWLFSYNRLQPLGTAWSAQLSVNGQQAGKNLESSEKFSLGGNSGVRAYPGGEGAGDSGLVASLTLRREMAWPTSSHRLEWSGFLDWGRIKLHQAGDQVVDNATGLNRYNLGGVGLGVSLAQTGSYRFALVWALALGSNPGRSLSGTNSDGQAKRSRVLLSLNIDL